MMNDDRPMEVVDYVPVSVVPPSFFTDESMAVIRHEVTLATQGDPAVFVDFGKSFVSDVLAFSSVFEVATRGYVALSEREWVLVFDREGRSIFPPADKVVVDLSEEIQALREKNVSFQEVAAPVEQATFSLAAVWETLPSELSLVDRTRSFLHKCSELVSPTFLLVLEGEIPFLPAACALSLLRSRVQGLSWRNETQTFSLFS